MGNKTLSAQAREALVTLEYYQSRRESIPEKKHPHHMTIRRLVSLGLAKDGRGILTKDGIDKAVQIRKSKALLAGFSDFLELLPAMVATERYAPEYVGDDGTRVLVEIIPHRSQHPREIDLRCFKVTVSGRWGDLIAERQYDLMTGGDSWVMRAENYDNSGGRSIAVIDLIESDNPEHIASMSLSMALQFHIMSEVLERIINDNQLEQ